MRIKALLQISESQSSGTQLLGDRTPEFGKQGALQGSAVTVVAAAASMMERVGTMMQTAMTARAVQYGTLSDIGEQQEQARRVVKTKTIVYRVMYAAGCWAQLRPVRGSCSPTKA